MNGHDPLAWMQFLTPSNRNTFMELGISPIITASILMQILMGSKVIQCDDIQEDKDNAKNSSLQTIALPQNSIRI